nr:MAG TPA: hypothetical protein [Caudoviricetes sp.]
MLLPVCREDGSIPSKGAFLLCHIEMIEFYIRLFSLGGQIIKLVCRQGFKRKEYEDYI